MPWDEYLLWVAHYGRHPPAFVARDRLEYVTAVGVASRCKVGGRQAKVEDVAAWRRTEPDVPGFEDWLAESEMVVANGA